MAIRFERARFDRAFATPEQLPPSTMPEVSFVGRSNVGKSSLINRLLRRKSLAKVSSTPGKTATINFYDVDGIYLVDLPGYGYAKRSKTEQQRWTDLIAGYYSQERSFNLVVSLVDIRHDAQDLDRQMIGFLQENRLPFIVALTKADKLSKSRQQAQLNALAGQFGIDPMAFVITSAQTGQGMDALRHFIDQAC